MANRYWVGGSGSWTNASTANWSASSGGGSGASAPTAADNVFFDQAGTYTVTLSLNPKCLSMTVSAGTVTIAGGSTLTISGGMSLVAGTVWSYTSELIFDATATGHTITTNGTTINSRISWSGVGGGWSLGSALTTLGGIGGTQATTLTAGNLNLNNFNLSTYLFSSQGSQVRNLTFGTGNVLLTTPTANSTVMQMYNLSNFTMSGTGGFATDASITRTFNVGNLSGATATNIPNLTLTGSGTSIATITTNSWFRHLNFGTTAFTVANTNLSLGGITLGGGNYASIRPTIVANGFINSNNLPLSNLTINNPGGETTLAANLRFANQASSTTGGINLNAGTLNLNSYTVTATYLNSSGASAANVRGIAFFNRGNLVLPNTIPQGTIAYNVSNATNFTASGNGYIIREAFTSVASNVRLDHGSNVGGNILTAPQLYLQGTASSIVITNSWWSTIDFQGYTGAGAYGPSLLLNVANAYTGTVAMTAPPINMVGNGNLRSTGVLNTGGGFSSMTINNPGGNTTLQTTFRANVINLISGNLNLNNFTLAVGQIFRTLPGNTSARGINFGTANILQYGTGSLDFGLDMQVATGYNQTASNGAGFGFRYPCACVRFGNVSGANILNAPNISYNYDSSATSVLPANIGNTSWFNFFDFNAYPGNMTNNFHARGFRLSGSGNTPAGVITLYASGDLYSNGGQSPFLTFRSGGNTGTTTLRDNLNVGRFADPASSIYGSVTGINHSSGNIDLNNFNFTTAAWTSTTSDNRHINFGTGNVYLTSPSDGATIINIPDMANWSYTTSGGMFVRDNAYRGAGFTPLIAISGTTVPRGANLGGLQLATSNSFGGFMTINLRGYYDYWYMGYKSQTDSFSTNTINAFFKNVTVDNGTDYLENSSIIYMNGTGNLNWVNGYAKAIYIDCANADGENAVTNLTGSFYSGTTGRFGLNLILKSGTFKLNNNSSSLIVFATQGTANKTLDWGSPSTTLTLTQSSNIQFGSQAQPRMRVYDATGFKQVNTGNFIIENDYGNPSGPVPYTYYYGNLAPGFGVANIPNWTSDQINNAPKLIFTTTTNANYAQVLGVFNTLDFSGLANRFALQGVPAGAGIYAQNIIPFSLPGENLSSGTGNYIYLVGSNASYTQPYGGGPVPYVLGINLIPNGNLRINNGDLQVQYRLTHTEGNVNFMGNRLQMTQPSAGISANHIEVGNGTWSNILAIDQLNFTGNSSNGPNGLSINQGGTFALVNLTNGITGTWRTNGAPVTNSNISVSNNTTFNIEPTANLSYVGNLTIDTGGNVILKVASPLNASSNIILNQGNINLDNFTLNAYDFISNTSGTLRSISGNSSGLGNITISNSWNVSNGTNFTGTNYNIYMTNATAKTFAGGVGGTYDNLIQAGAGNLTITGSSTFTDIYANVSGRPSNIRFTAGTTQTLTDFTLSGNAGNVITINSVTAGTKFNLFKPTGTANVVYLNIRDSNVSAEFYAGLNSVNSGNNAGWNFTTPAVVQGGFAGFFGDTSF